MAQTRHGSHPPPALKTPELWLHQAPSPKESSKTVSAGWEAPEGRELSCLGSQGPAPYALQSGHLLSS